jgi:hypothetical protein
MMRTIAQALVLTAALLLVIAEVQRAGSLIDAREARASKAERAAQADALLGVHREARIALGPAPR